MAIYLNGIFCKRSLYGIKLSGDADKLCDEIQKNKKANGSFRLELKERKEPDKNGNTHYVTVDEWEPAAKAANTPAILSGPATDLDSDVPF